MNGAELITADRQRQIDVEQWTPEHDDKHVAGEMSAASSAYTLMACEQIYPEQYRTFEEQSIYHRDSSWPWDKKWWKPSPDQIRNLVKAGALLCAEIDRLQRAEGKL